MVNSSENLQLEIECLMSKNKKVDIRPKISRIIDKNLSLLGSTRKCLQLELVNYNLLLDSSLVAVHLQACKNEAAAERPESESYLQ